MKLIQKSVVTSSLSASDSAAHRAASHVRSGFSRAGEEALHRAFTATERIREQQIAAAYEERAAQFDAELQYELAMADAA